jgi:GntR family transcriptional regulator
MMFKEQQAIYLQIVGYVCERILLKEWPERERIPSIRDLAILLEVNPNTIMRAYEFLQQRREIENERGVGLFVTLGSVKNARTYLHEELMLQRLPSFFRTLALLDMDLSDLKPAFEGYLSKHFKRLQRQRHEDK